MNCGRVWKMKKLTLFGAVASLVFTSQTRAQLDFHYNWLEQAGSGMIDASDWTVGPGFDAAGVTPLGRLFLDHPGVGGWRSVSSVLEVVRPHPTTGAVEIIADLWSQDGFGNFHAQYPGVAHGGEGFTEPAMAFGATWVGATPGPGGPGWTICVNGSGGCKQPVGAYIGDLPVRIRLSSSGDPGAGANLDGRLLDAATGQFLGEWFPIPATHHTERDLDLTLLGGQAPPFKFGFTVLGDCEWGMVEVYQNLGNDGALPAPGNLRGDPPVPLPPNGFQEPGEDNDNIPGDCNQDGTLNLSDVICLVGHLFQGNPSVLPCSTAAGNLALMDCNQDGRINISDAIYKVAFLFQGGPPPVRGQGCIAMAACPQNQGCP